jgi:hypothetical protein
MNARDLKDALGDYQYDAFDITNIFGCMGCGARVKCERSADGKRRLCGACRVKDALALLRAGRNV